MNFSVLSTTVLGGEECHPVNLRNRITLQRCLTLTKQSKYSVLVLCVGGISEADFGADFGFDNGFNSADVSRVHPGVDPVLKYGTVPGVALGVAS